MASVLQHTVGAEKMHDQYLPFSEAQLGECFAAVAAQEGAEVRDRRIAYYRDAVHRHEHAGDAAEPRSLRVAAQIEKDERIWVAAALMAVHYSDNRQAAICTLLRRCLGDTPPFAGKERWEDCFGPDTRLFFEVGLPSPSSYQHWLRTNLAQRQLIPYVRDLARNGRRLEGRTHLDAMLIDGDTGCAVLVEGKVTSDCSCQVTFDLLRNQLARNIDAMLERNPDLQPPLKHRDPDLSAFVLLTPRMFQENPRSRLYGWLMQEYQTSPSALHRDLPHRAVEATDWHDTVSRRLGWLTFEDIAETVPGACAWLANV